MEEYLWLKSLRPISKLSIHIYYLCFYIYFHVSNHFYCKPCDLECINLKQTVQHLEDCHDQVSMCNICGFFASNNPELLLHIKETHFLNSMPKEGNSEQEMTSEQIAEMIEEEEMPLKSEVKLEIDDIFLPPEQSNQFCYQKSY